MRDAIRYIELREDIAQGQRVESFQIETEDGDGGRLPFYQGTTIGNRRICELKDHFADQNPLTRTFSFEAKKLVIRITSARGEVRMKSIKAY